MWGSVRVCEWYKACWVCWRTASLCHDNPLYLSCVLQLSCLTWSIRKYIIRHVVMISRRAVVPQNCKMIRTWLSKRSPWEEFSRGTKTNWYQNKTSRMTNYWGLLAGFHSHQPRASKCWFPVLILFIKGFGESKEINLKWFISWIYYVI